MNITVSKVTGSKRVKCRYGDTCRSTLKGERFMREGTEYLSLSAYAAGGTTTIPVCKSCARKLFRKLNKVKDELKI